MPDVLKEVKIRTHRETLEVSMCAQRKDLERQMVAICKQRGEASEEDKFGDTLLLDFSLPEV